MTQTDRHIPKPQQCLPHEEIIAPNLYLPIGKDSILDDSAYYLAYSVQRELYNFCKNVEDLSWREFVDALYHREEVRNAAAIAVQVAIKKFYTHGQFDFNAVDRPFYQADDLTDAEDGNAIPTICELYEPEVGRQFIQEILLKVEIAQYKRQLDQGKNYSWDAYLIDIAQNIDLWNEITRVLRDALLRLDFSTVWQSKELEGLANQKPIKD